MYIIQAGTGQKQNANDWQTSERKTNMQNVSHKKAGPNLNQTAFPDKLAMLTDGRIKKQNHLYKPPDH